VDEMTATLSERAIRSQSNLAKAASNALHTLHAQESLAIEEERESLFST